MRRLAPILLCLCAGLLPAQNPAIHFVHGQWFNGERFAPGDLYAENGVFTRHPHDPGHAQVVDLAGGYVVPPYGDAHEHNFDHPAATPPVVAHYLQDGIFYAQGMTDTTVGAEQVVADHMVDTPETVDVTYAHGGLTGVNGHPKEVYESLALGFFYPTTPEQRAAVIAAHTMRGKAYWEIRSVADLDAQWPQILADHPDLIKVYLTDSEHFRPATPEAPELAKGIDPALVAPIVVHAHAAGLRVAAHIDTAADFHVAATAGVDIFAHLPGYGFGLGDDPASYRLADADIALASKHGSVMIPTAQLAAMDPRRASPDEQRAADRRKAMQIENLRRIKAAGIPVLVGSDHYGLDSLAEADYLHALGLWSNLEMLRMWSVATPHSIFPHRRLGLLAPGAEASFLVLEADPLQQWSAVHGIRDRWKQGAHVTQAH